MKTSRRQFITLTLAGTALTLGVGCGSLPKHVPQVARLSTPPEGKAIINFQRPTKYGGQLYAIFDGDGKLLCDLPGAAAYQYVCAPGEHVFIAWADAVSVVKAEVEAAQVYDIMVDVGMGWVRPNIKLVPVTKEDPRRDRLAEFEARQKWVVGIERTEHVVNYEQRNAAKIAEIKRDFLGGEKSDGVRHLSRTDHR
jgi:hypothetical protein